MSNMGKGAGYLSLGNKRSRVCLDVNIAFDDANI